MADEYVLKDFIVLNMFCCSCVITEKGDTETFNLPTSVRTQGGRVGRS